MRPIENPDGVLGDFRELMCSDGKKRLCIYVEQWEVVIINPKNYELLYNQLKSAVVDYLAHPSVDGSKERLRKREVLKDLIK